MQKTSLDNPVLLAMTTTPDEHHAQRITNALVQERLAACVNQIPGVRSSYVWQDKVQTDQEVLLLIKTTQQRWSRLRERILELHPYELPEIIAVSPLEGHKAYLDWVRDYCA